jgi:hypothetical protein
MDPIAFTYEKEEEKKKNTQEEEWRFAWLKDLFNTHNEVRFLLERILFHAQRTTHTQERNY